MVCVCVCVCLCVCVGKSPLGKGSLKIAQISSLGWFKLDLDCGRGWKYTAVQTTCIFLTLCLLILFLKSQTCRTLSAWSICRVWRESLQVICAPLWEELPILWTSALPQTAHHSSSSLSLRSQGRKSFLLPVCCCLKIFQDLSVIPKVLLNTQH